MIKEVEFTHKRNQSEDVDFTYDDDEQDGAPTSLSYAESESDNHNSSSRTLTQSHEGEHRDDYGGTNIPIQKATYIFAMCAAINSCNLGYDIGVNTSAGKLLQDSMTLSDFRLELFMGSLNFFAMLGALCSSAISDRMGRRGGFIFAAFGFILGIFIVSIAQSYTTLMFGRVFVGLGVGFGLAIDPLYISEISPAAHRGRLVTWSEIAINVGILFGFCAGLVFYEVKPSMAWRVMYGMGMILPVVLIFLVVFVMPESPRWLVTKGRYEDAKAVLSKVYPPGYNVEKLVREIKDSIQREREAEKGVGWGVILFPTPAVRRMLLVGVGAAVAQQAIGIDSVLYFMIFIIDESGIRDRFTQTIVLILLGVLKLLVIVYAGRKFDTKGRRPLMFVSLIGMMCALLLLALSFVVGLKYDTTISIIALGLYLAFFSYGMGPGAWLIPSEIFPTIIRAKAMSVATFLNRVTATLMASTFLSVSNALTWGGFFFLLASICFIVLVFMYFYLPETKGRSLEDMTLFFAEITGDQSILDADLKMHDDSDIGLVSYSEDGGVSIDGQEPNGTIV